MVELAQKHQDQLKRLKKSVERSWNYFQPNYERFNRIKRFAFFSALTTNDLSALEEIGQPQIECNLLEAFLSRQRGEFSKQEPSISVSPADENSTDQLSIIQTKIVEGYFRHLEDQARKDGLATTAYLNTLGGGFHVFKVWTDYVNEMSFDQNIRWGNAIDPCLCGFDPDAVLPHKGDGRYCFEIFPKTEEEAEEMGIDVSLVKFSRSIGQFNWSYKNDETKHFLICDFYEKKKKDVKIVQIAESELTKRMGLKKNITKDQYKELEEKWRSFGVIDQLPAIVNERMTEKTTIVRYRFIENKVLEYVETNFSDFPLIFVDGNSVLIKDDNSGSVQQVTRPAIYNAIGTQKLVNVAMQTLGNELENTMQHKLIVAEESISEQYADALTNYQVPRVIVYKAYLEKEGVEPGTIPLPPPREVVRAPIPPEITGTIQMGFQMLQNILGSYDASLGINNNQLSGVAIVEGATQSNAAAMPYVNSYIQGLNRVAQVVVNLLPKYIKTQRTLPVMMADGKRDYIKINGDDGISLDYEDNELLVKVDAGPNYAIQKSKTLNQIVALAGAMPSFNEFANSSQMLPVILKLLDIPYAEEMYSEVKAFIEQKKEQQKEQQLINAQTAHAKNLVDLDKHQTERVRAAVDMAIKAADMSHRHNKDMHDIHERRETREQERREHI